MASIADDESKTSNSGNGGNISPSLNESSNVPTYNFAVQGQGGKIPQVGFGTSGLKGEMGEEAIVEAIRCGYRLIDTALLYGNHMAAIWQPEELNPPQIPWIVVQVWCWPQR